MNKPRTAAALAAVLAVDGAIHLYWATGSTWPATDSASLSRAVLNADVPFTPPVLVPLAAVLAAGAATLLARGGLLRLPLAPAAARWGTRAVAAGLSLRALAGLVWLTGLGAAPGSTFYLLNAVVYTPLCLAAATAAWRLAR
ncbi:hypothetical protein GCM10010441_53230 [Kitasatospora paracochleata]|uniref:DUF3995 domain-containing protein n=1 Tax=Kitasatospora paracochleata TaxID=58354 RepID=A0ABT1IUV4_9ACTN|nr:DUF3995 domain-containing protein [Kitasatospora paracochleata]MCP2308912.1 hypothetical protein [Kitasatospora paracochleata]